MPSRFIYIIVRQRNINVVICVIINLRDVLINFRENSEVVIHSDDPIAPVGYLVFEKLGLEVKLPALDLFSRLEPTVEG